MTSKKQKQAGWPLPTVIDPGTTTQYCVTIPDDPHYKRAFFGAIWSLAKWWNWEKSYQPADVRARDAAQLFRDILYSGVIEGCGGGGTDMFELRDDPDNVCAVQQSIDGGLNWIHAFNKDTCNQFVPAPMSVVVANNSVTVVENNNTTYAGDIINIAPNFYWDKQIPMDGTLTNVLICFAIRQWVNVVCETVAMEIDAGGNVLLDIARFAGDIGLSLTNTALYIMTETIGPPQELVSAVAWASAKFWLEVLQWALTYDSPDFRDQDARDAVSCYMYNNLKDATLQFIPWQNSLSGFVPTTTSETAISEVVDITLQNEDAYVNFLTMVENVKDFADSLPECPCPEPFVRNQLVGMTGTDFYGTSFTEGTDKPISGLIAPGAYNVVADRYQSVISNCGNAACCIRIAIPIDTLVTYVRVTMYAGRFGAVAPCSRTALVWLGNDLEGGVLIGSWTWGAGTYTRQAITLTLVDGVDFTTQPADYIYIENQIDRSGGNAGVEWVHMSGIVAP